MKARFDLIQFPGRGLGMIRWKIILIMVVSPLFLLLGCSSASELSEFNFSENQGYSPKGAVPFNRANLAAFLQCDLSDFDAKVYGFEGWQSVRYLLVSCPKKGLKDIKCLQDSYYSECMDKSGNSQNNRDDSFFVH